VLLLLTMSRIDVVLDGVVRYSAAVMTNKEEQQHHPSRQQEVFLRLSQLGVPGTRGIVLVALALAP
jgi:hypothetical protein